MFLFSLCLIGLLVFLWLGYLSWFRNFLYGPIKYNSWVKIKRGFYSEFSGHVKDAGFFKYRVILYGREVNNTLKDKLDKSIKVWWFNLESADKPTELVKEDFYNEVTRDWNDTGTSSICVSALSTAVSTALSIPEDEED